eukprot:6483340-Amphidinium_carterae.1
MLALNAWQPYTTQHVLQYISVAEDELNADDLFDLSHGCLPLGDTQNRNRLIRNLTSKHYNNVYSRTQTC